MHDENGPMDLKRQAIFWPAEQGRLQSLSREDYARQAEAPLGLLDDIHCSVFGELKHLECRAPVMGNTARPLTSK